MNEQGENFQFGILSVGQAAGTLLSGMVQILTPPVLAIAVNAKSIDVELPTNVHRFECNSAREGIDEAAFRALTKHLNLVFLLSEKADEASAWVASSFARSLKEGGIGVIALLVGQNDSEHQRGQPAAKGWTKALESNCEAVVELASCPSVWLSSQLGAIERGALFCRTVACALSENGAIAVDFEDVCTVLRGGHISMAIGESSPGVASPMDALQEAMRSSVVTREMLTTALGVLFVVEAPKGALTLPQLREVMREVSAISSPLAHVVYAATFEEREGLVGGVRVYLLVAHGVKRCHPGS